MIVGAALHYAVPSPCVLVCSICYPCGSVAKVCSLAACRGLIAIRVCSTCCWLCVKYEVWAWWGLQQFVFLCSIWPCNSISATLQCSAVVQPAVLQCFAGLFLHVQAPGCCHLPTCSHLATADVQCPCCSTGCSILEPEAQAGSHHGGLAGLAENHWGHAPGVAA